MPEQDQLSGGLRRVRHVVVVGAENVGKSTLVAALTGSRPRIGNLRGTTAACERSAKDGLEWIDTPGLLQGADSVAMTRTLAVAESAEAFLAVCSAQNLAPQLDIVWPIVAGKAGALVLTRWDRVQNLCNANDWLAQLQALARVPVFALDARRLSAEQALAIRRAFEHPAHFPAHAPCGIRELSPASASRSLLDLQGVGPALGLAGLLAPTWIAVQGSITVADLFQPFVQDLFAPVIERATRWPSPLPDLLAGDYGLLSMLPFLFLYALPLVLIVGLLQALYKLSGLLDHLACATHPWMRPLGLTGRDLVRILMGFGCNVPAVINTRACSIHSRGQCVSAIAFGAACSYQLSATLAVFAAAGRPRLSLAYLLWLAATSAVYLRVTAPREFLHANRSLAMPGRTRLVLPDPMSVAREILFAVRQFVEIALPIFILVCLGAGTLAASGVLDVAQRAVQPLMALFRLPADVAPAVLLGSIRKDGIAIGLLDGPTASLKVPELSAAQLLTAVYIAGVAVPCAVTSLAIWRELGRRFVAKMLARQAVAAAFFSCLLGWAPLGADLLRSAFKRFLELGATS